MVNPREAALAFSPSPVLATLSAVTVRKYSCTPEPAGGAPPTYWCAPASPASWNAPLGRCAASGAPAPAGHEVVPAGMSATTQCQKPLPVGACGSYIETTKLSVSAGKPQHDNRGERSRPPGPPKLLDNRSK